MTRKNRKASEPYIGYYVVGFIDILGQQERLRALGGLPDKQDVAQMETFRAALKQTYGAVSEMQESFQNFFNAFSRRKADLSQLTSAQKAQFRTLTSEPIKFQLFSDSMVIFLSLRDDRFKLPIRGVFGVLGAAATFSLYALAAGHPARGGIDIGVAMEMTEGEIYGAALARAYALESRVAWYPRIVLGKELIEYLQLTLKQEADNVDATAGRQIAKCCLDMIANDDDGHASLDYLGEGFKKHIAIELNVDVIKRAYRQVLKYQEQYRLENNTMLAFRYTLLRNYFEARLHVWTPEAG